MAGRICWSGVSAMKSVIAQHRPVSAFLTYQPDDPSRLQIPHKIFLWLLLSRLYLNIIHDCTALECGILQLKTYNQHSKLFAESAPHARQFRHEKRLLLEVRLKSFRSFTYTKSCPSWSISQTHRVISEVKRYAPQKEALSFLLESFDCVILYFLRDETCTKNYQRGVTLLLDGYVEEKTRILHIIW